MSRPQIELMLNFIRRSIYGHATQSNQNFSRIFRGVTRLKSPLLCSPGAHIIAHGGGTALPPTFPIDIIQRAFHTTFTKLVKPTEAYDDNTDVDVGHEALSGSTSINDEDAVSTYDEWHNHKRQELHDLSKTTDQLLTAASFNNNDIDSILELMRRWASFNEQITPEMHSLSKFRKKNQRYPPSEFMTSVTFDAASRCQSLLTHLLAGNNLPPNAQVQAYKLSMETWAQVHHFSCGDRAEDILDAYGEKFGGDMDLAPTLDCYKIVLRGHDRSSSSYFMQDYDSLEEEGSRTPGEKAWEVLNLLTGVSAWGDLYLKPDFELYSHCISAMRNDLLDWKGRMRKSSLGGKRYDELAMKSDNTFFDMENLINEKNNEHSGLTLHEWHYMIRAYVDMIAIVARVKLEGCGKFKQTPVEILHKLELIISANAEEIGRAAALGCNSTILNDVEHNIQEAYINAISSGLNPADRHSHVNSHGLMKALEKVSSSEKILLRMKDRSRVSLPFLFPSPTQDHYSALIERVCECMRIDRSAMGDDVMSKVEEFPHHKAARLLGELEQLCDMGQNVDPVDGSIYNRVIWATCQVVFWKSLLQQEKFFDVADSIQELLKNVEDRYDNGLVVFSSNADATKMFNSVFRFYSKRSKNKTGGVGRRLQSRTLRLLDQLENWHKKSAGKIKPDEYTFHLIIKILSDNGSFDVAQSMFSRMEAFGMKPNEKHYHAAMRAQSRANPMIKNNKSHIEAISMLQEVKERYAADGSAKPTTSLYTACLSAFAGSSEHNIVAEVLKLYKELTDLYESTNDEDFKPNNMFYNATLDALAKSKDDSAVDHCLRILDEVETKYSDGILDSGPNRFLYTSVLQSIANSSRKDYVAIAEDLMQRMTKRSSDPNYESMLPDKMTYTTMFEVLANNSQQNSIDLAKRWFTEMENQYTNGDDSVKPNKRTYTALIKCWTKSNRPDAHEKVAEMLSRMENEYKEGHFDSKPDAYVYGSIIKLLSKSKSDDKASKVWKLYEEMKRKYESGDIEMQPNNVVVSSDDMCHFFVSFYLTVFAVDVCHFHMWPHEFKQNCSI